MTTMYKDETETRATNTPGDGATERVIERETDPATGHVTERVIQTVPADARAVVVPGPAPAPMSTAPTSPAPAPPESVTPHAPPTDQDEIYYEGSPLLRGELDKILVYGGIGIVLMMIPIFMPRMFNGTLPAWWHWWLTAAFLVAGLVVLLVPLIMTRSIRYRVTNYRINWERGLFGKDIDTLELWHVEDLKFRQSIFQRMMGVGTITIMTHDDTTPNLVLRSVPNARYLFETLQQRVIAVKRGPGVLKVDTGS